MQIGTMYIYRDIEPSIEKWEILFSHSELENTKNFFFGKPRTLSPLSTVGKVFFFLWFDFTLSNISPFQSAIADEVNSYWSKIHCRLQLGLVVVYQNRKKNIILEWKGGKIAALRNNPARIEATLIETLFLILPKSVIEWHGKPFDV